MEKQYNYIDDMTNRYIYQVTKHLPAKSRKDIKEELVALINEMLEERSNNHPPAKEDIILVLTELGSPYDLAMKYSDKSLCLIGPLIYPAYLMVLKIVLCATLFGLSVTAIIGLLTESNVIWYEYLGSTLLNILLGLTQAFSWVTIIFAINERRGINPKDLIPAWELSSLPPVPDREITIPLWEPIFGITFSILVMVLLITAPQLIGVYYFTDTVHVVSIFNLEVLQKALPLLLICFGLGIIINIWEIVEKKISLRYAVISSIIKTASVAILIIIFTKFPIWNQNFVKESNENFIVFENFDLTVIWHLFTSSFVILIITIYLIDIIVTLYKGIKFNR